MHCIGNCNWLIYDMHVQSQIIKRIQQNVKIYLKIDIKIGGSTECKDRFKGIYKDKDNPNS